MTTTATRPKPIGADDLVPLKVADIDDFERKLYDVLLFAEAADMRLGRIMSANEAGEDSGWGAIPDDFSISEETFTAYFLLADMLDTHATIMRRWIEEIRNSLPFLYWERRVGGRGESSDTSE